MGEVLIPLGDPQVTHNGSKSTDDSITEKRDPNTLIEHLEGEGRERMGVRIPSLLTSTQPNPIQEKICI